jgi:ParB/RepB/Spo0J family partition protein
MATASIPATLPAVDVIALERIQMANNVRHDLPDIESLADSMRRHGVLTAITVMRRDDGDFDLVAGQRRLAAARLAGLEAIPAVVQDGATDAERLRRQLAENLDREGLRDLDQAEAMQQLLALGLTAEVVAETVRTTPDNVRAWADLLRLPKKVRRLIESGRMTAAEGHLLVALLDDGDAMRAALERIGAGYGVDRAVATVQRERELERKHTAARERLEAEGCPIIDAPSWGSFPATSKTQTLGKGHRDVSIPLRQHAKLPCHAAYVAIHNGDVVYVCTNRNAHAGVDGSGVADLRAERAARRAQKKALREAHTLRFGTMRDAIRNHAISAEEATRHVLRLTIDDAEPRDLEMAAAMLGVAVPKSHHLSAEREALLAHAASGPEALLDVALAVAIARGERSLTSERFDWRRSLVAEHASLIRSTGVHQLSEVEEELIRERTPRSWDATDLSEADESTPATAA